MKILVTLDDGNIIARSRDMHDYDLTAAEFVLDGIEVLLRPIWPDGQESYWLEKNWSPVPEYCYDGIEVEILEDIKDEC